MTECAREITWLGGTHVFDLNSPRSRWLLRNRPFPGQFGDTPAACLRRFEESVYSIDDVERVIEYGLIGGGQTPEASRSAVADHVTGKPLSANALLAYEVIGALFVGAAKVEA